jgi:bacterioferritin (cytochrome b1)
MKLKAYQVTFPATLVLVMVTFLFTIFIANANLSFAAADTKAAPAKAAADVKATPAKEAKSIDRISAVEHTETQIKMLEGALNITAAQKELWNDVTQVMRENAKDSDASRDARRKARAERHENATSRTAVEHMKSHLETTESHLDQMKKLIPPFEALYASMSSEQKKTTDAIFDTGKHRKHGKHAKQGKDGKDEKNPVK